MTEITDYTTFTTMNTPKDERRKLGVGKIWENKAQCKKCLDIIQSKNEHDMRWCKCGAISVDGGSWYLKRSAKDIADCKELSVYYTDV